MPLEAVRQPRGHGLQVGQRADPRHGEIVERDGDAEGQLGHGLARRRGEQGSERKQ
jgi:hypothetical protein